MNVLPQQLMTTLPQESVILTKENSQQKENLMQIYAYDVSTLKLKMQHNILPTKKLCAIFILLDFTARMRKKNKNT